MSIGATVNCVRCGKPGVLPLPFPDLAGVSQSEIVDALARTEPGGWAVEGRHDRGGRKILCPQCRTPRDRPAGPKDLSPFTADPACPACGASDAYVYAAAAPDEALEVPRAETPVYLERHEMKYCEGDSFQKTCPAGGGPHLHYDCHRCGRKWATACKGAEHG